MNIRKHPLAMEYALLGLLCEQPMHGYEIYQKLQASHREGLVWRVKQGMLYAMLARLEAEDLLVSSVETQGARPPRKLYSLTAKGDYVLQAWLQSPVRNGRDFRLEFLTKLYFAQRMSRMAALTLIRGQSAATEAQLSHLAPEAAVQASPGSFVTLVSDFRTGQLEAVLAWLKHCEKIFTMQRAD